MSNQFNLLREACRLNNAGAVFLANNDSGNAVTALKASLMIMHRVSQEAFLDDVDDDIMSSPDECLFVEVPGLDDSFFVYKRALLLDVVNAPDPAFFNAIVLFNLALTFHQCGKKHGEEAKLRRAAYFYHLAAQLIAGIPNNHGALLVATLNNQAQIYLELFDHEQAIPLLLHASKLSEQIPAPPANSSSSSYFELEHMEAVFLNAALATKPVAAASA